MIRKIKTSLTAKLFLATTVLLILVCLLSVFSMARYIPQTYSNRLSAELQKQANDLVPVLEKAGSLEECYSLVQQFTAQTKATAYIEDDYGDILYSSDKLTITTDKDSIATIQENPDSAIITSDELLTEAGYVFTLLGSDYGEARHPHRQGGSKPADRCRQQAAERNQSPHYPALSLVERRSGKTTNTAKQLDCFVGGPAAVEHSPHPHR